MMLLLIGWSNLIPLQENVSFSGGNSKYSCVAAEARQNIIDTYTWSITDGGSNSPLNCDSFRTTWKTDNEGPSLDNQIIIPTIGGGYDYDVDWGDGTYSFGVTSSILHDYPYPGTWTVTIEGNFPQIYFDNNGDKEKLLTIENWGENSWSSMENAFYGCSNLEINATDAPDLSNVYSMVRMFSNCFSLNSDIGYWYVSNVKDMSFAFSNAITFDQDLGAWNVSEVVNMTGMFDQVTLSTENYDALLMGWANLSLQSNVNFSGGNSLYCLGEEARDNMMGSPFNWSITDGGFGCPLISGAFVTKWKTDNPGASADNQITIPTYNGNNYNYIVDWGDDNIDYGITGEITHTYDVPGEYEVSISGDFPGILFSFYIGEGDEEKILSVEQWGEIHWTTMTTAFFGCKNLVINATDAPDLTGVISMHYMFGKCSSLNQEINHWDVSNVENMSGLFSGASLFNQDISDWDVSHVTNMFNMFSFTDYFNQDISDWDVSAVENMDGMFYFATSFNQDVGQWEDVSNVENMNHMFGGATLFNKDISSWNVSNVERMRYMFYEATSFDQDISNWVVSNVEDFYGIFYNATLSTENYDALLIGWAQQPLYTGLIFHGGYSTYCLGESARQSLEAIGWIITDGGLDCSGRPENDFPPNQNYFSGLTKDEMLIYPNPASDFIQIDGLDINPINRILIYNSLGVQVLDIPAVNRLDISELPNGTYLIKMSDGIEQVSKHFVKM